MIYELNHVGIVIRDLDKSVAFYQDVLGGKVAVRNRIPSSQTDIVYLQIAGGLIELLHRREPAAHEVFGITHIAFMTDDLDADYRALVDTGCESLVAPKVAGSGVGRLGFLGDPNGARVELIQRDVDYRTAPIEHGVVKSLDHYSVRANDLVAARDFYGRRLGMNLLKQMYIEQRQLDILYFNLNYDVVELLHRPTPDTGDIFGHIALRVENVDRALERVAALGVAAEPGTPKPAGNGIGRIGIIRDPDGVRIELLDRPDLRTL
ncbi:MAG TPA: VOC family protein [bacterium]|nr:VOC family protein [bacterium]